MVSNVPASFCLRLKVEVDGSRSSSTRFAPPVVCSTVTDVTWVAKYCVTSGSRLTRSGTATPLSE